ncbi:MAG: hypothetical protein QM762_14720 [Chryseolinea sp.]
MKVPLLILTLLAFSCNDSPTVVTPAPIRDFNVYPNDLVSACATNNGNYILNLGDSVASIDPNGNLNWYYSDSLSYVSSVFASNDNGVYIISNPRNGPPARGTTNWTSIVKFRIDKLDENGNLQWRKTYWTLQHPTTTNHRSFYNEVDNFYLRYQDFGLGYQDSSGDIFVVHSYDVGPSTIAHFKLLRLSSSGELQQQQDFEMDGSYSRAYTIKSFDGNIYLATGGNRSYRLYQFSQDLTLLRSYKGDNDDRDPTFSNILQSTDGSIIFTGQIDRVNNEDINTNYDCAYVVWNDSPEIIPNYFGLTANRERCFSSVLDSNGRVMLLYGRRSRNELSSSVRSDLGIVCSENSVRNPCDNTLSKGFGLEGIFLDRIGTNEYVVIGTKFGFQTEVNVAGEAPRVGSDGNTFFMKVVLN